MADAGVRGYWPDRLILVLLVGLIGVESLFFAFGRDQGIHATIAFALREGRVPYLDIYNIKPPLTTAVHWLSQVLFGHTIAAIRQLDLIQVALVAVLLHSIALRLLANRFVAFCTGLAYALLYYSSNYWEIAQTDGWTSVFVAAAFALVLRWGVADSSVARRWAVVGAGVLFALAFLLKYTVVLVSLPAFIWLIMNPHTRRRLGGDMLLVLLAFAATLLLCFGALAYGNALDAFFETQQFIFTYSQVYSAPAWDVWVYGFYRLVSEAVFICLLAAIGLLTVVWQCIKDRKLTALVSFSLLWFLSGYFAGVIQSKGFPYHYLPALPAMAVLAGVGAMRILDTLPAAFLTGRRAQAAAILLLALVVSWVPKSWQKVTELISNDRKYSNYYVYFFESADYSWSESELLREYIEKEFPADATMFLWGYETGVYYQLKKVPVSRFIYTWPLVVNYSQGRYNQQLMTELQAALPDIFVVQSGDATPYVTGEERDSREVLEDFPELQAFLAEHYNLSTVVARYDVYQLRDRAR